MAFTDNCDLHGAVHEDGLNLVVRHIMRQRPSWFNYATAYVATHPEVACEKVDRTFDVDNRGNPLFGIKGPVPVLGADAPAFGLNYAVQVTSAEIDFYPGNVVNLPAELAPPLGAQRFALAVKMCGGRDCLADALIANLQP